MKQYYMICLSSFMIPLCVAGDELKTSEQKANLVFNVLLKAEHSPYIGELVTQLQHALQAAFHAQHKYPSDNEFIIACLLHDIGHQLADDSMDGWGVRNHEQLGADYLRQLGFSDKVCSLVQGHIDAKRYLCTIDVAYCAQLSDASKHTMAFQGALMSSEQQEAFKRDPLFEQKIMLRRCDDLAKDPHAQVPQLNYYVDIVVDHLRLYTR